MTNPTTPFSWQMPTSSDLVTDLPADFETFGQAVATSMADLLGGTTGQILSKATNTDMDFTWITNDVGDITAVTAGTGISGGGTSGAVTITNSMATAIDAKGDLVAGTGADTFARLPVSASNVAFLRADSGETTGLKWDNDAWTSWTPTYNGFTAGNATVVAKYKQIGKTVYAYIKILLGTTSSVSSDFNFSLPVTTTIAYPGSLGTASVEDAGTTMRPCFTVTTTTTTCTVRGINTAGTYSAEANFSSTVPQTWVSGDAIVANLVYEAA